MVEQKTHGVDSIVSYAAGGGLFAFSSFAEIVTYAQQIGIILGCLVVLVRLVHDGMKLYHYIKNKDKC